MTIAIFNKFYIFLIDGKEIVIIKRIIPFFSKLIAVNDAIENSDKLISDFIFYNNE